MKVPVEDWFLASVQNREYLAEVVAAAEKTDSGLMIEQSALSEITGRYFSGPKREKPEIPLPEGYPERLAICRTCEHWIEDGWAGLGKCKVCGCSGLKLRLKGQKCPVGKW